ncbi:hypothetical protein RRX38_02710 [Pseudomonas sp. DTU_2021_1001937_2_SI_NGA_ILE_001]|uniref:hypothetical protein n=1 Tax=Pseudomonas sp. DTU_2021_1001937_2_SI_NGA_ILE_001 TaxID=3077589 RepID=UPI0028FC2BE5|nr:hypothetical protein [Pseudomonas sp. DTU_2021_1001937_2_SI_NGA_ILE_001]WNW10102.1 hypothetical protein RRX38_02710 [Pseudomonas sp. DTU_2021_1001937_2_SI_NGA_ILE_001]
MSSQAQLATQMIEQEISRITESQFPSDDLVVGMILANYRHGFIDELQVEQLEAQAAKAVLDRRTALRAEKSARHQQSLGLLYEVRHDHTAS